MAFVFFVFTAGKVGESGEIITHTHTRPLRLFAIFIGCQMADTCPLVRSWPVGHLATWPPGLTLPGRGHKPKSLVCTGPESRRNGQKGAALRNQLTGNFNYFTDCVWIVQMTRAKCQYHQCMFECLCISSLFDPSSDELLTVLLL